MSQSRYAYMQWNDGYIILCNFGGRSPSRRKKKAKSPVWIERRKLLRHVAMIAKFLDDNKPKTSLKKSIRTVSNFINLTQFHLIRKILAKLSEVEPEKTVSGLEKEKENFVLCLPIPWSGHVKLGSFMSQTCNDG